MGFEMNAYTEYIENEQHYEKVLMKSLQVRRQLWIGTSDIKDLHVKRSRDVIPFLSELAILLKKGIEVRLIHAKEPGEYFRKDFDKHPILSTQLERMLCPRAHFKLFIFDMSEVYIGSANLTGAGVGMKSKYTRNFETGILTSVPELVQKAVHQYDKVWIGLECETCKRKDFCGDPLR